MTKGTISIVSTVVLLVAASFLALASVGGETATSDQTAFGTEDPVETPVLSDHFTRNDGQWSEPLFFMGDTSFGQVAFGRSKVYLNIVTSSPEPPRDGMEDPRSTGGPVEEEPSRQTGFVVVLDFEGASPVVPKGYDPLEGVNNYFYGNDPDMWRTEVPNYGGIVFEDLWAGIDLMYYFSDGSLKYEFVISPGADPNRIAVSVEGIEGLSVKGGELKMDLDGTNSFVDGGLVAYYSDGSNEAVQVQFDILYGNTYAFSLEGFDRSRGLVIDPLYYSTFIGGSSSDYGYDVAVDSSGNAYLTGYTSSSNFPVTSGAYDTSYSSTDGFITKFNYAGSALYYSTYFGGSSTEYGYSIAIDSSGNAYVTGYTSSSNFPVTSGAYDTSYYSADSYVLKLNSAGSGLSYSTYLGASTTDYGYGIAVDSSGNAYITGMTYSTDFPVTSSAYDRFHNGYYDVFVTKLNSAGSGLSYSTFLGGDDYDYGYDITVDSSGNAYVTGYTYYWSAAFPTTTGAYDTTPNGGYDAFATKLNSAGSALTFSTFLGGDNTDYGYGICIDSSLNVYVACYTYGGSSIIFPTTSGAYDTTHNGGIDVAVCKLNSAGSSLTYSTFVGGSSSDYPQRGTCKVGYNNNVYVGGYTLSSNFPVTSGAYDTTYNSNEGFIFNLSADFTTLSYCTYFGSTSSDYVYGMGFDSFSNVYMTGYTSTSNFPVTSGAYDTSWNSGADAFVFKFGTANMDDHSPPRIDSDNTDLTAYTSQTFTFRAVLSDNVGITRAYVEYWIDSGGHTNTSFPLIPPYNHAIIIPGALGTLYYFFTATDFYGNWLKGPTGSRLIIDGTPPTFSNRYLSPSPTTGETTTAYVDVTDNVGVSASSVTVYYRNWRDASYTSATMNSAGGNTYSYTFTCGNDWETLYYYFTARDTSSNLGTSTTQSVSVFDDETPTLVSDDSPTTAYTGDTYTFSFTLNDNVGIAWVDVTYWFGSGWNNYLTIYPTTTGYGYDQTITGTISIPLYSLDDLYYYIDFYDWYYNWDYTWPVMVDVVDNDVPTVTSLNNPMATTGDSFFFNVSLDDNIDGPQVQKAHVLRCYNYDWGNAVNMTLTYDSTLQVWKSGNFNINLNSLDPLTYYITAVDVAGNWMNAGPFVETVYDNDIPTYTWPDSSPSAGTTGDPFTFTVRAQDNIAIGEILVVPVYDDMTEIDPIYLTEGPTGTFTGTLPLDFRTTSDLHYHYMIYDSSWNFDETPQDKVTISDNDDPEIVSDMSPKSASAANVYTFKTLVLDNIGVETVWISYWYADDTTPRTQDMVNLEGGMYYYNVTLPPRAGTLYYYFDAIDEWDNSPQPTETREVRIIDNYAPELSGLDYPSVAYTGDDYIITIDVIDDVQVDYVRAYYYFGDTMPGVVDVLNGMKSGDTYSFEIKVPDALDSLHFWITSADMVGNPSIIPIIDVPVMDNDRPVVTDDRSDPVATTGDPFHFTVNCTDNIGVLKVEVSYRLPGMDADAVEELVRDSDTFSFEISLPNDVKGEMSYRFTGYDTSLNVLELEAVVMTLEDDEAPAAVIEGPVKAVQHEEVTFSAAGSSDNVGITAYTWNIDGQVFSTVDVTYKFDIAGSYLIELLIEDGSNPSSEAELLLTVIDIDDPAIALDVPDEIGNHLELFANASGSTDNIGITSYSWLLIMPDNTRVTGTGPTFSMPLIGVLGEVILYLTVMDEAANSAQEVRFIQILDTQPPIVKAPSSTALLEGAKVTFSDQGSTDNVGVSAYMWTVEGPLGTVTQWGKEFDYFFEDEGNYSVTLTVYDSSDNNASAFFNVEVSAKEPSFDGDSDGIPDVWEDQFGLDRTMEDADRDYDRDLLSNMEEYLLGTDPKNPDTDGDGMPDGWEDENGLDPAVADADADPDKDGHPNLEEYFDDRDPQVSDNPKETEDQSVLYLVLVILAILLVIGIVAAIVIYASKLPEN